MYRFDWIEQLKRKLGGTSFLTDISAEMVNSALPVYLVLFLRMSPPQYGAIDALYNGLAVALLSLAAGFVADRTRRPKHVAVAGYGLSAMCKLLLLAAGGVWIWILAVLRCSAWRCCCCSFPTPGRTVRPPIEGAPCGAASCCRRSR